jgi:hypothetical protein
MVMGSEVGNHLEHDGCKGSPEITGTGLKAGRRKVEGNIGAAFIYHQVKNYSHFNSSGYISTLWLL